MQKDSLARAAVAGFLTIFLTTAIVLYLLFKWMLMIDQYHLAIMSTLLLALYPLVMLFMFHLGRTYSHGIIEGFKMGGNLYDTVIRSMYHLRQRAPEQPALTVERPAPGRGYVIPMLPKTTEGGPDIIEM